MGIILILLGLLGLALIDLAAFLRDVGPGKASITTFISMFLIIIGLGLALSDISFFNEFRLPDPSF